MIVMMMMIKDFAIALRLRDVRLNLPEFTWLISCSIVTDHYIFQRFKGLFFGYLQEVGAEGYAWLSITFNVLHIL